MKSFISRGVGWLGALALLGSLAHATPIVDLGSNNLHISAIPVVASTVHKEAQAATSRGNDSSHSYAFGLSTWPGSAGTCTLATNCGATLQVAEPQSLLLVGSGLLSIAGLLRRRLAR